MSSSSELRGFYTWLLSLLIVFLYFVWALLPDDVLVAIGVVYYPSRYWAVAIPCYLWFSFIMYLITYSFLCISTTFPLDSPYALCDDAHQMEHPISLSEDKDAESIPEVADIPITSLNKLMFYAEYPAGHTTAVSGGRFM